MILSLSHAEKCLHSNIKYTHIGDRRCEVKSDHAEQKNDLGSLVF